VYGKGVRDLERMVTGVRCEAGRERERKDEGGHLLMEEVDCKSCRCCEGLLDGDGKRGIAWRGTHTMVLVLDDVVRVGEWLVLRREWIGGVKELIDSILHDWPVDCGSLSLSQTISSVSLSSRAPLPLSLFPFNGRKTVGLPSSSSSLALC
jgi:hypothetical protein